MNPLLIKWSKQFSDLPWRSNRSMYNTLVSEIMLQQTTVGTVKNKFNRFIEQYPDIQILANINEEEILIAWKGLGYYRRARNLLKAAQFICDNCNFIIPSDIEILKKIPGIGDYTANALKAIGANESTLCVDSNLERVLSRYFLIDEPKGPRLKKAIQQLGLTDTLNTLGPRALNEALMDLGREICHSTKAICRQCPLGDKCKAYLHNCVGSFPKVVKKEKVRLELLLERFVVWDREKILLHKRESNQWLSGQFEIPTFIIKTADKKLKQYPKKCTSTSQMTNSFKSAITKYSITNNIYTLTPAEWNELVLHEKIDTHTFEFQDLNEAPNISSSSQKSLEIKEIAIIIFLKSDGSVYLQKRKEEGPLLGLYEFPGGKIEKNETPLEAAKREFSEEVNIVLSSHATWTFFKDYYHHYNERTVHLHAFLLRDPGNSKANKTNWYPIKKVEVAIPNANKKIFKDLLKLT